MSPKLSKSLTYFGMGVVGLAVCGLIPWVAGNKMSPEKALSVAESAPEVRGRVTKAGSLLSGTDPDMAISKARNRASGRSPAHDVDASMEMDFAKLSREFLARSAMASDDEKLKEFFPDGKGVNRSIRMTLLLAARGLDSEDSFSEIQLSNRVQSEIFANAESAFVSLNAGLASFPKEMVRERQTVIRLLSNIATQQPELRSEVKASLLAEAGRASTPAESAVVLAALLRVSPSKEWKEEVNQSYERLHPGSDLTEVVAMNTLVF